MTAPDGDCFVLAENAGSPAETRPSAPVAYTLGGLPPRASFPYIALQKGALLGRKTLQLRVGFNQL
jgi:hypothetical protein